MNGRTSLPRTSTFIRCSTKTRRKRSCVRSERPALSWRTQSMNYDIDFPSLRDEVSEQEWQTRVTLAACYRLLDRFGMTDLIYNHITAKIPGTDDHLLINLYGMTYREITASSLVKIDLDGNI